MSRSRHRGGAASTIQTDLALYGKVREHPRDCQRCGSTFTTTRVVAYCPSCYTEKRGTRPGR